jgi:hypothetical protein
MIKSNLQLALLIDGDNAQPTLIPSILEAVGKHGTCVIRRVYGDWTAQNMSGWRELERTHAIQLVGQLGWTSPYLGMRRATKRTLGSSARTAQQMPSSGLTAELTPAIPNKRGRVDIPGQGGSFKPHNDFFRGSGRLTVQGATFQKALNGFAHIQPSVQRQREWDTVRGRMKRYFPI